VGTGPSRGYRLDQSPHVEVIIQDSRIESHKMTLVKFLMTKTDLPLIFAVSLDFESMFLGFVNDGLNEILWGHELHLSINRIYQKKIKLFDYFILIKGLYYTGIWATIQCPWILDARQTIAGPRKMVFFYLD
jgi:hypothetical protein